MGYCPFVLQKKKNIVLQLSEKWVELYCSLREKCVAIGRVLKLVGLYCNRVQSYCRDTGWEGSVSRYNFCIVNGAAG